MALSVFAALIVITAFGVTWGSVALALRQPQRLTMEQTDDTGGLAVAEDGSASGWQITPDHMRMW